LGLVAPLRARAISQLKLLEEFLKRRNEIALRYKAGLEKIDVVSPISVPSHIRHAYYKYPVIVDEEINVEKLSRTMKQEYGVETGSIYYPPCHLH
jgi:dTDP-4-amino-4,6-dideoxygalactose transaminase